jgi:hypothetical protein
VRPDLHIVRFDEQLILNSEVDPRDGVLGGKKTPTTNAASTGSTSEIIWVRCVNITRQRELMTREYHDWQERQQEGRSIGIEA